MNYFWVDEEKCVSLGAIFLAVMNTRFFRLSGFLISLFLVMPSAHAGVLNANFNTPSDIPVSAPNYVATGNAVEIRLNHAPALAQPLTVVENTGNQFIQGVFGNLTQGQVVLLTFGSVTYTYVANYYGGTGNDLVLAWVRARPFTWGENSSGQLGNNTNTLSPIPTQSTANAALANKTVVSMAAGQSHTLALCSDGTVFSWGANNFGQLGDTTNNSQLQPVAVAMTGTALQGKKVIAIAAGQNHSLALCSDGTIAAWGLNTDGQLGDFSNAPRPAAVAVQSTGALAGRTVAGIAAGANHSVAFCTDGTVYAWGRNDMSQLGDNNAPNAQNRPVPVNSTTALNTRQVVAIASGANHTLVLCSDGALVTWGDNTEGQHGNGGMTASFTPVQVNIGGTVLFGKTVKRIAAGGFHNLVLCTDGTLAAWGKGSQGQIGDGTVAPHPTPAPVTITGTPLDSKQITFIAAGGIHSLALCSDGTLASWGGNGAGQLGDGTLAPKLTPSAVNTTTLQPMERMAGVYSGPLSTHTLSIVPLPPPPPTEIAVFKNSGTLPVDELFTPAPFAFPATTVGNSLQQVFTIQNTGGSILTPINIFSTGPNSADFIPGPAGTTTLLPGATVEFIVTYNPTGIGARNAQIQIATNDGDENPFVINVTANATPVALVATYNTGNEVPMLTNGFGGAGSTVNFTLNYTPITGHELKVVNVLGSAPIASPFDNLAQGQLVPLTFGGGTYNFLANYYGGNGNDLVLFWSPTQPYGTGFNVNGELGNNSTLGSSLLTPVDTTGVLNGRTVVKVASGGMHSLALCLDGTLVAWGSNASGELGDGTNADSLVPVPLNTLGTLAGKRVVDIAAGISMSMVLCSDGSLHAWGLNADGQLGIGNFADRNLPMMINGSGAISSNNVVAIAAGAYHAMALLKDGTLAAWGRNSLGQLGNNSTINVTAPVSINNSGALAGQLVVAISAGEYHGLALLDNGILTSWGNNIQGQLGNGSFTDSFVPAPIDQSGLLAGKTIKSISAGGSHNLVLCQDGTLASWGWNLFGQAGDGSTVDREFPTSVNITGVLAGKTVVEIAAYKAHSVVRCADSTVASWGSNIAGQLGDGTLLDRTLPVLLDLSPLNPVDRISQISSGSSADHTLALVARGPAEISVFTGSAIPANERFNGGTFSFANTGVSTIGMPQTFTIKNTGSAPLTGLLTSSNGGNAADFVASSPASNTLAPGASTTFTVAFSPSAPGLRGTTILINSNDLDENPFTISVSGTGLSNNADLSALSTPAGGLTPGFTSFGVNYTVNVPNATASANLTATLADTNATLTVDGNSASSGVSYGPIALVVGTNPIAVSVTAEDGVTLKTYTINFVRAPSSNANLASLAPSTGLLSPTFFNAVFSYSVSVSNATTTFAVTPTVADSTATIRVNTISVASGSPSGSIPLTVGSNPITVEVTAQDGTTILNYTVNVTRAPSSNATLSGLSSSVGTLSPPFVGGTFNYTINVPNGTSSASVTANTADATATLAINSTPASSGSPSSLIPLVVGPNSIPVRVTAQNTTTILNYNVTINRAPSSNATLSNFSLSGVTLAPLFSSGTFSYTGNVPNSTTSISATAFVADPAATLTINGTPRASGSALNGIPLMVGTNNISVNVIAQDGSTALLYTAVVTRAPSSNALLASLSTSVGGLSPVFSSGTFSYTVFVPSSTTTATVTPAVMDTTAAIKVQGVTLASGAASASIPLAIGSNVVSVDVTAQDGTTTQPYTVDIYRYLNSDATLSDLTTSGGAINPVFNPFTFGYTANVPAITSSTTVTPTVNDPNATIEVNGTPVASGVPTSVTLISGPNLITVDVTAEDGTTIYNYTLTVTRGVSSNANLFDLITSDGSLSPVFDSGTFTYQIYVGNSTTDITVNPTVEDATATILVDGTPVSSGFDSGLLPLSVGSNFISVDVTAEDGSTTQNYALEVIRDPSNDATLSDLTTTAGAINPGFNPFGFSYTANVSAATASTTVTSTVNDSTATIQVDGIPVASGATSAPIALIAGPNIITVDVFAEDGITIYTYTLTVTRGVSSNANLFNLYTSDGSLSPAFNSATITYQIFVGNSTTDITVNPTVEDALATILVDGTPVSSGFDSGLLPLSVGSNFISVDVTAEDGSTTQNYALEVIRDPSNDATLADLTTSTGTLSSVFDASSFSYTVSVPGGVTTASVTPTVNEPNATIEVDGSPVSSGTPSSTIVLSVGSNVVTVDVTAEDGSTIFTYTVDFVRGAGSDTTLSSLTTTAAGSLSPAFNSGVFSYTASVPNSTVTATITPTATDPGATIEVNGTPVASGAASPLIPLATGLNTISVDVTAQDGSITQSYTLDITRAQDTDATLFDLTTTAGALSPAFSSGVFNYTVSVPLATTSASVTPTVNYLNATVSVNGSPVPSGTASGPQALAVGPNLINVDVLAEDGTTTLNYTVTVTRGASNNASLAALTTTAGTLAPVFSPGTYTYSVSVGNGTSSITITPTTADPSATLTVNGIPVASGSPSPGINLVVGTNIIPINVLAQDGMTTLSYSIRVVRGLSSNANLSSLTTSVGSIMPVFTPGVLGYSVNTGSATATITPIAQDTAATITVNGTPATSGTPSSPVALALGTNLINVDVTSGDGTIRTYVVTFNVIATFDAIFNTATDIPATSSGFNAVGTAISFTLNFVPTTGTELTVISNTSQDFIIGYFTGLPQGQIVPLTHGGNVYNFVADYFGGDGNDLVLLWAGAKSFAWGDNDYGQLGDATTTDRHLPSPATTAGVLAGKTVASIAMGTVHTVARMADGSVVAWGFNNYGQLGDGTQTQRHVPVAVSASGALAGKTVAAVAAGGFHSMVLCSDGTVVTWGNNGFGQLGNGNQTASSTPVAVNTAGPLSGKTVIAISAGYVHCMALCSDGTLVAWGNNREGELGDGTNVSSNVPVVVINTGALDDKIAVAISAGAYHSMALCSDGSLVSWGNNSSGQLGDGSTDQSLVPVLINIGSIIGIQETVLAISAGGYHSMALISDGTVATWGGNGEGQLGIGSKTSSALPVAITGSGVLAGRTAVAVAAGAYHSTVLCSDGTLATFGRNKEGQLGDNSTSQRLAPVFASTSPLTPGALFTKVYYGATTYHNFAAVALPPAPEISIFKGVSTEASDEMQSKEVFQFDLTTVGSSSVTQTFTIQNTGTIPLNGISIALAVTDNPDEFVISAPALSTLPINATTTFTVTFLPTASGARSASLRVASDDSDENPFTINLFGSDTDITAAVLEPVAILSDNAQPNLAKAGDMITLTFTASEAIQTPVVVIAGEAAVVQDTGDNIWIATRVVGPTTPQGPAAIHIAFVDMAGNPGFVSETTNESSVTIDTIAPIVAVPGNIFVDPLGGPNATVNFSVTATDNLSIPLVNVVPPSGSVFPLGNTIVTATATDQVGNTTLKTFVVRVVAIAPDSVKPTVSIHAPKQNAKIPGDEFSLITVNGLAADDTQVANVFVSLNGGTFFPASLLPVGGGVGWMIGVTPDNGLNSITVKSVDIIGNESSPATVSFKYVNVRSLLAGDYHGLVVPTEDSVTPAEQVGYLSLKVLGNGSFTGKLTLSGAPNPIVLKGVFGNDGSARFGKIAESSFQIVRKNKAPLTLFLALDVLSPGTDKITGILEETGNEVATVNADRFLYTDKPNPVAPRMNVPSSLFDPATDKGKYTVALPSLTAEEQGVAPGAFPQGDGWALLSVSPSGFAKAVGKLADGTAFTCAKPLSKSNEWPLYIPLYGGKGSLSGAVTFRDISGVSDADATGLRWFRPAGGGKIYSDGWPDGLEVDFVASRYVPPTAGSGQNALLIDGALSASIPNVEITVTDELTFDPLINNASMDAASVTTNRSTGPGTAGNLKLSIKPATGKFAGSFDYQPVNIKKTSFNGVILQKQHTGIGYFIGGPAGSKPASGAVIISPLQELIQ